MNGAEFKSLRIAKGYTRNEIGAYLDRHRNTIRYWETGRTPVPKWAADWMRNADAKKIPA